MRVLSILKFLFMFAFFSYVDAAEGQGGGDGDIGDFVIEDDPAGDENKEDPKQDPEPEKKEDKPPSENKEEQEEKEELSKDEKIAKLEEELNALKEEQGEVSEFVTAKKMEELVTAETEKLQQRYPDFDIEVIGKYLNDLVKEDPAKAEALNNPVGWENIYLKMEIENGRGEFLPTRGVSKEPFDFDKTAKKAEAGDDRAVQELFDNIK